jgi:hypothetical protein
MEDGVDAGEEGKAARQRPWFYPFVEPLWSESERGSAVKFAPDDITDGRPVGEWRTRYPREIHYVIQWEAIYLASLGMALLALGAASWLVCRGALNGYVGLIPTVAKGLGRGLLSFAGGGLGGTLFGLKWLYHSVARGVWSLDRRLWRLFTPWISGALAVAFVALVDSDIVRLLNSAAIQQPAGVLGASFLVGYFSDTTIGKLNELVLALFGQKEAKRGGERPTPPTGENVG